MMLQIKSKLHKEDRKLITDDVAVVGDFNSVAFRVCEQEVWKQIAFCRLYNGTGGTVVWIIQWYRLYNGTGGLNLFRKRWKTTVTRMSRTAKTKLALI